MNIEHLFQWIGLPDLSYYTLTWLALGGLIVIILLLLLIIFRSNKVNKFPSSIDDFIKSAEALGDKELVAFLNVFDIARLTKTTPEYFVYAFTYIDKVIVPIQPTIKKSVDDIKIKYFKFKE